MINITDRRARMRIHRELVSVMVRLESSFFKSVSYIIRRQFNEAAKAVEKGRPNVDWQVDKFQDQFIKALEKQYIKTGKTFFDILNKYLKEQEKSIMPIEQKTYFQDFMTWLRGWTALNATKKIATDINPSTKRKIHKLLRVGAAEGLSSQEISKQIRNQGLIDSRWRANTIARTETHTASMVSTQNAMILTKVETKKSWSASGDARTRIEHQEADNKYTFDPIPMDQSYEVGGEELMYPGDSGGSAWNVINCRCVEMYHTVQSDGGIV